MLGLLEQVEAVAAVASARILQLRGAGDGWVNKADGSPVTEADRQAEDLILQRLATLLPGIPIVAEECVGENGVPDVMGGRFFLVDALDGTKEFIKGATDFTVNIALIEAGKPVLGVVAAPARGELYSGIAGEGAWRTVLSALGQRGPRHAINVRQPVEKLVAVTSASHMTPSTRDLLDQLPNLEIVSVGSSLKFCLIASGAADIYPRLGRTMQWDTAAGDAVVRAAGGRTLERGFAPLAYGPRPGGTHPFENPEFISVGQLSTLRESQLAASGCLLDDVSDCRVSRTLD
jgi:3'(2'), 5'-bisphosphate nucleotidase